VKLDEQQVCAETDNTLIVLESTESEETCKVIDAHKETIFVLENKNEPQPAIERIDAMANTSSTRASEASKRLGSQVEAQGKSVPKLSNIQTDPVLGDTIRPAVKLTVETTRHDQAPTPESPTTKSTKPWCTSVKFQEVAPKIDFVEWAGEEIELVREAPLRLPSRFFWRSRRGQCVATGANTFVAEERPEPQVDMSSSRFLQQACNSSPPEANQTEQESMPPPRLEIKRRSFRMIARVKSHFQPNTKTNEQGNVPSAIRIKALSAKGFAAARNKLSERSNRKRFDAPSPISLIPAVSHQAKECETNNSKNSYSGRLSPRKHGESSDCEEQTPQASKPRVDLVLDDCSDPSPIQDHLEPCPTYDEARALEQAKKQFHAENSRFVCPDHRRQDRETPITLHPYIDFNPCKEELQEESSCGAHKKDMNGIAIGDPFAAKTIGEFANAKQVPGVKQAAPTSLNELTFDEESRAAKPQATGAIDETNNAASKCHDLTKSKSQSDASSSLKKVLRRIAKHRVAFKEDLDLTSENKYSRRFSPQASGKSKRRPIPENESDADMVLRQLMSPIPPMGNVPRKKEEMATAAKNEVKKELIPAGKCPEKIQVRIEDKKKEPHARSKKPSLRVSTPHKCVIVRELVLSPSDTTRTSVRFKEPTTNDKPKSNRKKLADARGRYKRDRKPQMRQPVVHATDVETLKQKCDETVATGGTKVSAISGVSRLTTAERELARRLATDIRILAKIEKKRRVLGEQRSPTKTKEIEKSLKLLQSINASRHERNIKEEGRSETSDMANQKPKETAPQEPSSTALNFFSTFYLFGK
jgi:hypothetical protein